MQASSSRSLSCNFSFPLCVSGITRRLTLSNEMVDHERRRRAMRRQRSMGGGGAAADRSLDSSGDLRLRRGNLPRRGTVVLRSDDEIRDGAGVGGAGSGCGSDKGGQCRGCCRCLPCAAKAA